MRAFCLFPSILLEYTREKLYLQHPLFSEGLWYLRIYRRKGEYSNDDRFDSPLKIEFPNTAIANTKGGYIIAGAIGGGAQMVRHGLPTLRQ